MKLDASHGGLEKLKIIAFESDEYESATDTYVVMYNPTSYSYNVRSEWIAEEGVDSEAKKYQFRASKSDKVSFEFLFDATGASPPGQDTPGDIDKSLLSYDNKGIQAEEEHSAIKIINKEGHVEGAIRRYLEIIQGIQSKTHTPNYLQINWGAYQFRGVVENTNIKYKLFNSSGLPIRATATTNFVQSLSREEQKEEASNESADLTHKRVVKAGDTLPLIAKRIYGDPSFYMQIAKVNNLKNFRDIAPGQELILPPIEK